MITYEIKTKNQNISVKCTLQVNGMKKNRSNRNVNEHHLISFSHATFDRHIYSYVGCMITQLRESSVIKRA